MRTKSVVKWGLVGLVALTATALWIIATDEHLSRHEYKWQKSSKYVTQDVPFGKRP